MTQMKKGENLNPYIGFSLLIVIIIVAIIVITYILKYAEDQKKYHRTNIMGSYITNSNLVL